ncbi:MAG TPA: hypothetical protein VJ965_11350 [Anaerolineales bacterium]|nr:hypothetical protein [Anaerolineales bacterium]
MKQYSTAGRETKERAKEPHPIWRGIGLIMMVMIPLVSFALSDILLQFARTKNISIPEELRSGITEIPLYGDIQDIYAVLILTAAIMLILFSIFTIINAAVYRASSGRTYQVFESKPKSYKKKRKLRKP